MVLFLLDVAVDLPETFDDAGRSTGEGDTIVWKVGIPLLGQGVVSLVREEWFDNQTILVEVVGDGPALVGPVFLGGMLFSHTDQKQYGSLNLA